VPAVSSTDATAALPVAATLRRLRCWLDALFARRGARALLFVLAILGICVRRPDALLHPQFWAEDGVVWYADAYNLGAWNAALHAESSYFQTLPRLVAGVALLVPLPWAPLLTNVAALCVEAAPLLLLWHRRWDTNVASPTARVVLMAWYVLLPNQQEVHANVTNAQWFFALYTWMVFVAAPPLGWTGRLHDAAVFLLFGLSGPFCICLAPFAVVRWWRHRDGHASAAVLLSLTMLLQLASLAALFAAARQHSSLGANCFALLHLLGSKLFGALLLGPNAVHRLLRCGWLALVAFSVGTAILAIAWWRGPGTLRSLILFAMGLLAAALIAPNVTPAGDQWEVMGQVAMAGSRYFLLPMVATMAAMVWLGSQVAAANGWRRGVAAACCVLAAIGIYHGAVHYRLQAFADLGFAARAAAFDALPPGTPMLIPINPDWQMRLVKH
jgi:hypothetical protein